MKFAKHIATDEFIEEMNDRKKCSTLYVCLVTEMLRVFAPSNPFESSDNVKVRVVF